MSSSTRLFVQDEFGPKARVQFKTVDMKQVFKDNLREFYHNISNNVLGEDYTLFWNPIRVGNHKRKHGLTFQMYKFLKDQQEQGVIPTEYEVRTGNDAGDIFIHGFNIAYIMFKDDVPTMKFIDRSLTKFGLEALQDVMNDKFAELLM